MDSSYVLRAIFKFPLRHPSFHPFTTHSVKIQKKYWLLGKACLPIICWLLWFILRESVQLDWFCEASCVICAVKIKLVFLNWLSVKNGNQQEAHTKSEFSLVIKRCLLTEDTIWIYFPTGSLLNIAVFRNRNC